MEKDLKWAVYKLKDLVKESHIKGQKHIDLSLANAYDRDTYQEALLISRLAVENGEINEQELKELLGLN